MKPLGVQLYSVRDYCKKDFPGTLKKIADIGFKGVEFAGFHDCNVKELKKIVDDLGLKVCSCHVGMPNADNAAEIIDNLLTLDCKYAISGPGGPMKTAAQVLECAVRQQKAIDLLNPHGIEFGLHNHDQEFAPVPDGRLPQFMMVEAVPALFCELDIYWVKVGGQCPAEIMDALSTRVTHVHVKDGMVEPRQPMKPIGQGVIDVPEALAEIDPVVCQWLIVELDSCEKEMIQALAESYEYLTSNKLALGNK